MKKILFLMLAVASLTSCQIAPVNGDEEAVLISKPWFFGHGGVKDNAVTPGAAIVSFTTSVVRFKVIPVTYQEHFQDMITADNTPVKFSAYLKLKVRKGETPDLYKNFGEDWYNNSLSPTFKAIVRDKASGYKLFELTSDRKILANIEISLDSQIRAYVKSINLPVDIMQVTIGAITPPDEVLEQTKQTAAQNQSKLTQDAKALAEKARYQAEINKALSDKAYLNQMGMTIPEFLQLRNLEIEKEKVELVRDKQNVSIILGTGIQPMFNAK
jgi:regulator of protease activity HflC (stomatin/prohibitin superfamily)